MRAGARRMLREQQTATLQQPLAKMMMLGGIDHIDPTAEHRQRRGVGRIVVRTETR